MRGSVEETLNELLEAEAEKLTQAARYALMLQQFHLVREEYSEQETEALIQVV